MDVGDPDPAVVDLLGILRRTLRMDVAWLGRLTGDLLVLQVLDGDAQRFSLAPGVTVRAEKGLYTQILRGTAPEVIPDIHADPRVTQTAGFHELGIRSYAATPVHDHDGSLYGLVGCLGSRPQRAPSPADGPFLRLLATSLRTSILDLHRMWGTRARLFQTILDLIDNGGPRVVFQPVRDLADGTVLGVEALSRFPGSSHGPQWWFAAAHNVGLGADLEKAAIRQALRALGHLPPGVLLGVNASPTTITTELVELLVNARPAGHLVIEVTENEQLGDSTLDGNLAALRLGGVRLAIDDLGTGYSSLEHVIRLHPDYIKIDASIIRNIDVDPVRRAVTSGIVSISRELSEQVIAEGVETASQLRAIIQAGIPYGQGYLLGPPAPTLELAGTRLLAAPPEPARFGRHR
ncbi:EAL domain-containing protein [Frankia sp. AgB32]|uniref:sensor domain-containing phosphodiesterase n=1 Tax=Frankia sp. AgB32 TaxID=631119 RepID=UPI002010571B|nr:EAL domain-containing protein [Frankia sp. AgB32]MCK9897824.1 EAL domain-containing protein [Frankia sp. AgB32]